MMYLFCHAKHKIQIQILNLNIDLTECLLGIGAIVENLLFRVKIRKNINSFVLIPMSTSLIPCEQYGVISRTIWSKYFYSLNE